MLDKLIPLVFLKTLLQPSCPDQIGFSWILLFGIICGIGGFIVGVFATVWCLCPSVRNLASNIIHTAASVWLSRQGARNQAEAARSRLSHYRLE